MSYISDDLVGNSGFLSLYLWYLELTKKEREYHFNMEERKKQRSMDPILVLGGNNFWRAIGELKSQRVKTRFHYIIDYP